MPGVAKAKWPFTYYDFESDLEGWSNIGGGTHTWAIDAAGRSPGIGYQVPQYVGPSDWDTRDSSTSVLWLRSPQFQILIPDASLTFALTGGNHGTPPANESAVPTGEGATSSGYQFVGLRDVLTGDFVLTKQRANSDNPSWEIAGWTAAELAAYLNDGKYYTLDVIDQDTGSWGWFGLSRTRIPGW